MIEKANKHASDFYWSEHAKQAPKAAAALTDAQLGQLVRDTLLQSSLHDLHSQAEIKRLQSYADRTADALATAEAEIEALEADLDSALAYGDVSELAAVIHKRFSIGERKEFWVTWDLLMTGCD